MDDPDPSSAQARPPSHRASCPAIEVPAFLSPAGRIEFLRSVKTYAAHLRIHVERAGQSGPRHDPLEYRSETVEEATRTLASRIALLSDSPDALTVPDDALADDDAFYPVPDHLTMWGLVAYGRAVDDYAFWLGRLVQYVGQYRSPWQRDAEREYGPDAVVEARTAMHRKIEMLSDKSVDPETVVRPAAAPEKRKLFDLWTVLAAILMPVTSLGLGPVANHLHGVLSWVLFGVFVLTGATGLFAVVMSLRNRR